MRFRKTLAAAAVGIVAISGIATAIPAMADDAPDVPVVVETTEPVVESAPAPAPVEQTDTSNDVATEPVVEDPAPVPEPEPAPAVEPQAVVPVPEPEPASNDPPAEQPLMRSAAVQVQTIGGGQDVCPSTGGWTKIDGVNAKTKTITAPNGYLISDVCYKASTTRVGPTTLGTPVASYTFTSTVTNWKGNIQDISHVAYKLVPMPKSSASYLYQKVDPTKPASWTNSGRQTLIQTREGWSWLTEFPGELPANVCGDGWAIQDDQGYGPTSMFPAVVDRSTGEGVLGWPPLTDARHYDLSDLVEVPDCVITYPVTVQPEFTPGTCQASGTVTAQETVAYTVSITGPLNARTVTYVAKPGYQLTGQTVFGPYDTTKVPWDNAACKPTFEVVKECGTITITYHNNSPWDRWPDYRIGDQAPSGDYGSGPVYSVVKVLAGQSKVIYQGTYDEDEFGGSVNVGYQDILGAERDIDTPMQYVSVNTDCEPNLNEGDPQVTVEKGCGFVELTFSNDVELGEHEYAETAVFYYTDADGVKQTVPVEPNAEPVTVKVTFPEDSGDQSVTYWLPGDEVGTTVTVETDCEPNLVDVVDVGVGQMTCTSTEDGQEIAGGAIEPPDVTGGTYSIEGDVWLDLPAGDYPVTFTPDEGNIIGELPDGWTLNEDGTATIVITIDEVEDCAVQPDDKVIKTEWKDGTWKCDDTVVTQTRTVTTIPYILVDNTWMLDEEHATVKQETQPRNLTASERTICPKPPVTPPLANTGFGGLGPIGWTAGFATLMGLGLLGATAAMKKRHQPRHALGQIDD